jgi:hypothetical protein
MLNPMNYSDPIMYSLAYNNELPSIFKIKDTYMMPGEKDMMNKSNNDNIDKSDKSDNNSLGPVYVNRGAW